MWSDDFIEKNKSIGIDLIVVINASPFEIDKFSERKRKAKKNVKEYKSDLIYLNHVGCQDELIFDGGSFFMNKSGKIIYQEDFFCENEKILDLNKVIKDNPSKVIKNNTSLLYDALVFSLRSYMKDNSFKTVTIGLSGGIDSALCSIIATDAIGSENVRVVFMPTTFTSKESEIDSIQLSKNLNLNLIKISIESLRKIFCQNLIFYSKIYQMISLKKIFNLELEGFY